MAYDLISADSHINEPPDLWTSRAPQSLADRVPRVVSLPEGDAWIMYPGAEARTVSLGAVAGRKPEEFAAAPVTYREMRPGSFDPVARIEDQNIDGVVAEVLYPSPPTGASLDTIHDSEVRRFCAQAYNDWIAEFQNHDPSRLVGVAVLPPLDDGTAAVEELRRAASIGLRTALLAIGDVAFSDPRGEDLWSAAEELGMPIALHTGAGKTISRIVQSISGFGAPGTFEARMMMLTFTMAQYISVLMFSGVMDRHPKLKVVIVESGVGWIPYMLERGDYLFEKHRFHLGSSIARKPSDIWRGQFLATFQEDHAGLALRNDMGAETMMWASDYPHSATTWPESQRVVKEYFGGLTDEELHQITNLNAKQLYQL